MGILNVTPDSFSDGGQFNSTDKALLEAQKQVAAGVDVVDVGGQSTRPGALQISPEEEINRVVPVIKLLREHLDIPISVDTTRALVAQAALEVGADLVNDISAGTYDEQMFPTVASWGVPIVLMHIRGTPETMQQLTDYQDVVGEVKEFLAVRTQKAIESGIEAENIIVDLGIGFAKKYQQNIELLQQMEHLKSLGYPLLVGVSRKSFIGHILGQKDPQKRVWGTAAACTVAIAHGADILRVHDVAAMYDVARVADAIFRQK